MISFTFQSKNELLVISVIVIRVMSNQANTLQYGKTYQAHNKSNLRYGKRFEYNAGTKNSKQTSLSCVGQYSDFKGSIYLEML